MSKESSPRIPIPLSQRWRDLRMQGIPVLVFAGVVFAIAAVWKDYVAAPTMVGQAEPVVANVSSYKAGVLAELNATRFMKVKAGDPIGRVLVTDPRILASSLEVIKAEIESLRVGMKPIAMAQRSAIDYDQMRLDWMKERAQLATSKVNLDLAETEFNRMQELFKDQIVSKRVFEQAKATREKLQQEVDGLDKLVREGERNLAELQLTNSVDASKVTLDPLRAQIAAEEARLKLTEDELSPITLTAPMDGIVSMIYHRTGEAVTAGQPILAIATLQSMRIIGYMRAPILDEPRVDMKVEVRTRGLRREVGIGQIKSVGTQLEAMPATIVGPIKLASSELGLPIDISLPPNMRIRPGEIVDLTVLTKEPN